MTRNDCLLIGVLLLAALSPLMINSGSEKNFALIKVDGVLVRKLDLSAEARLELEAGGGKNIVEIKNGAVSVAEADCPDKICVRRGAIKHVGEAIACVPHKVLIEIAED